VRAGVDVPNQLVDDLATQLRLRLDRYMTDPDHDERLLDRRYGWRGDQVPVAVLDRPRVGATVRHRRSKGR